MTVLSNLKLTYFAIPGRAESIRLALKIGGIPFEDIRVEFPQWMELIGDTPWGKLPYIDLSDGTRLAQQRAILRLIGKETGLYPTDPIEAAKVDELCDALDDMVQWTVNTTGGSNVLGRLAMGMDQAAKDAARKETPETATLAAKLKTLDAYIAKSGSVGYAVGDKLTVADIFIASTLCTIDNGILDGVPDNVFDPYENIKALMKNVVNHPKISGYLDEMKDKMHYDAFTRAK